MFETVLCHCLPLSIRPNAIRDDDLRDVQPQGEITDARGSLQRAVVWLDGNQQDIDMFGRSPAEMLQPSLHVQHYDVGLAHEVAGDAARNSMRLAAAADACLKHLAHDEQLYSIGRQYAVVGDELWDRLMQMDIRLPVGVLTPFGQPVRHRWRIRGLLSRNAQAQRQIRVRIHVERQHTLVIARQYACQRASDGGLADTTFARYGKFHKNTPICMMLRVLYPTAAPASFRIR